MADNVALGVHVLDPITGIKGIVVCRIDWLYGCVRLGVQRPVQKDGKVPDIDYLDEPQVRIIAGKSIKPAAKQVAKSPAGGRDDPPQRRQR